MLGNFDKCLLDVYKTASLFSCERRMPLHSKACPAAVSRFAILRTSEFASSNSSEHLCYLPQRPRTPRPSSTLPFRVQVIIHHERRSRSLHHPPPSPNLSSNLPHRIQTRPRRHSPQLPRHRPLPTNNRRKKTINSFPDDSRQVAGILNHPHPRYKIDKNNITFTSERIDYEYETYAACIADSPTAAGVPASPLYLYLSHIKDKAAEASGVQQT